MARTTRAAIGDEPSPHWIRAPGPPQLDPQADLEVLRERFHVGRLPDDHPVRVLWSADTERLTLHHLADDIKTVGNVPGAKALVKVLRRDKEGFEDFRYELRMAAALARSEGQRVLRLAGPNFGPDIEFTAKSGHRCGVACYRGRSTIGGIVESRAALKAISDRFLRRFAFKQLDADLLIEMIFPELPLRSADVGLASDLLHEFWLRVDVGQMDKNGIRVQRLALPPFPRHPGELRRCRIRFLLPLRVAERKRVLGHLRTKMPAEVEKWAASYGGVALLAVEESEGIHNGAIRTEIAEEMKDSSHAFAGVLLTHYPEHGMEHIDWIPRRGDALGLHVGIETFGMNFRVWAGERPAVSFTPDNATEEWDFVRTAHGPYQQLAKPLSLQSRHALLPPLKDPNRRPTQDPDFEANLRVAIAQVRG